MKTASSRAQSTFQWAPYLFVLPTVGLIGLFSLSPMVYGVWMSLQKVDVIRGTSSFIGIRNYLRLFHDPQFGLSVFNTAWYTLTVVPLIIAGSIAIAVFLRQSRPALLMARVGFYIPFVLSPVVVATSWKWLLNEDLGVIDGFLKWAGMSTIPWLSSDFSARVSVVLASVWNLVGFYMLMILAGLSQISPDLYEAARIEGANAWQRFWQHYVADAEADDSVGGYPGNGTCHAGFRDDSVADRRWTGRCDAACGAEHVSGCLWSTTTWLRCGAGGYPVSGYPVCRLVTDAAVQAGGSHLVHASQ